jgi:hypothetical protein
VRAVLGWLTEKQTSLPLRFFWIKEYSLAAIPNHKIALRETSSRKALRPKLSEILSKSMAHCLEILNLPHMTYAEPLPS